MLVGVSEYRREDLWWLGDDSIAFCAMQIVHQLIVDIWL